MRDTEQEKEGIWYNNEAIWSMNYVGRVLDEKFKGDFFKRSFVIS